MKRELNPMHSLCSGWVVVWLVFLVSPLIAQPGQPDTKAKEEAPAGGPPQGPPPALVVVDDITSGRLAPTTQFIGTVYYKDVSNVASEVEGRVEGVYFEEGQRVKKDKKLVHLDEEITRKNLRIGQSALEENRSEIEKAKLDLKRAETLFQQNSASEEDFDNARYHLSSLDKRQRGLLAAVERIETELKKKTIYTPFDGLVLEKQVEIGEWVSEGATIAVIAFQDEMDILVDVPESILSYVSKGLKVRAEIMGRTVRGSVVTILPRGDVATRTFTIKIRIANRINLIEGMEARVWLPTNKPQNAVLIPRDAVLNEAGSQVVYTVENGSFTRHVVEPIGYEGLKVAVQSDVLSPGMKVITKGNERLRPGQPVQIAE